MGGLRILGGLMQGIGAGQAESARLSLEQQHAMAMENLRSTNTRAEATHTGDINDRNASRQNSRSTDSTLIVNRQAGDIQAEADQRRRVYDVDDREDNQTFEAGQGALSRQHAAAMEQLRFTNQRAADEYDAQVRAGEIQGTFVGDNGELMIVRNNGSIESTGQMTNERDRYAGRNGLGLGALDAVNSAGGGSTATPAPGPTSTNPRRPTAQRITSEQQYNALPSGAEFIGPDGQRYVKP